MKPPRALLPLCLVPLLVAVAACDIGFGSEFHAQETAEWRKTFELERGGRVEIRNVNGQIAVEPGSGSTVEVVALKRARAASPEAAREALDRIEIVENVAPDAVRLETRHPPPSGLFGRGGGEVRYTVKVPPSSSLRLSTVNGGIELLGVDGEVDVETTNGGIRARDIGGPIQASTTNGGVDVEVTRVADRGVKLSCTNGGVRLRLPAEARADISASVTNGGIDADGLTLEISESSRRRLEARLNGGGPPITLEGTNGGIRLGPR